MDRNGQTQDFPDTSRVNSEKVPISLRSVSAFGAHFSRFPSATSMVSSLSFRAARDGQKKPGQVYLLNAVCTHRRPKTRHI